MIEQMEAFTAALKTHADALNNFADAVRNSGLETAATPPVEKTSANVVEYDEPILWIDNKTGKYGECANSDEWVKVKTSSTTVVKVPESKYKAFVAEQEAKADKDEEKPADKKPARTRKPKAKKEPEETNDKPEIDIPEVSDDDFVAAFQGFMSQDLDKAERDERIKFVKAMLQRFGAGRATELKGDNRGIAVRLIQLKADGFAIDPEAAGWDPVSIIAECEAEANDDDNLV